MSKYKWVTIRAKNPKELRKQMQLIKYETWLQKCRRPFLFFWYVYQKNPDLFKEILKEYKEQRK